MVPGPLDERLNHFLGTRIKSDMTVSNGHSGIRFDIVIQVFLCLVHASIEVIVKDVVGQSCCRSYSVIECDVLNIASDQSIANRKCYCGHSACHLERTFITFINNYMSDVEL